MSVLIFAGYGPRIFSNIPRIKWVSYKHSPAEYFLLFAILVIALTALIVLMERGIKKISVRFDDGMEAYMPLKFTSAGITPVYWGSILIGLPITAFEFMNRSAFQRIYVSLLPGHFGYYIIYILILFFLYYLFTSFFYNPKEVVSFLRNKSGSVLPPSGQDEESYIDRSLEIMVPIAALYLCLVLFVPNAIFDLFLNFHLDSVSLIVVVAVLFDLIQDVRLRRKNDFVKVAELHDVPMAGLLKSLFEQKGVPCYLRGYYHRALLYFFGPYIEISVLVPEERVFDAREIVENYFDAGVLTGPRGDAPPHPSPLPPGEREIMRRGTAEDKVFFPFG